VPDRPPAPADDRLPWWTHENGPRPRGRFAGRGPRGYRRADASIDDEINARLTMHPDVDATDIEVHVADGAVTLTGSVDDRHQKRVAELIAEDVAGVDNVTNRIGVRRGLSSYLHGDHAERRGG
jgi:HSP20 family molecular chaperone IbpA